MHCFIESPQLQRNCSPVVALDMPRKAIACFTNACVDDKEPHVCIKKCSYKLSEARCKELHEISKPAEATCNNNTMHANTLITCMEAAAHSNVVVPNQLRSEAVVLVRCPELGHIDRYSQYASVQQMRGKALSEHRKAAQAPGHIRSMTEHFARSSAIDLLSSKSRSLYPNQHLKIASSIQAISDLQEDGQYDSFRQHECVHFLSCTVRS
jgi:hypothetical protein